MPGYILHLTEAKLICDGLKAKGFDMPWEWENEFKLGSLLPDTKLRPHKKECHFWDEEGMKKLAIAPNLDLFMAKYGERLNSPLMLAYWCHLHLDYLYVHDFWKECVAFKNDAGEPAELWTDITKVVILKNGKEVPVSEFFTDAYYYGDYGRSNDWLMHNYDVTLPEYKVYPCIADEIDYSFLAQMLSFFKDVRLKHKLGDEADMTVFTTEGFGRFVESSAAKAIDMIEPYVKAMHLL